MSAWWARRLQPQPWKGWQQAPAALAFPIALDQSIVFAEMCLHHGWKAHTGL